MKSKAMKKIAYSTKVKNALQMTPYHISHFRRLSFLKACIDQYTCPVINSIVDPFLLLLFSFLNERSSFLGS